MIIWKIAKEEPEALAIPEKNKTQMNNTSRIFYGIFFLFVLLMPLAAKKVADKASTKVSITPQDAQKLNYYFYEAISQRQMGQLDAAIDLLTKCYYINPQNAAVLYEFAMIYTNIQDIQHALKFMSLASKYDGSNVFYKMGLAELCIKNNDYKNAILIYKDIAKNHPEGENVDYMLASLYKQTNQPKESIKALNEVEKKNGINEALSFEKYRLYMELADEKKAYAEFDRLIEKYPFEYRYRLMRGDIYLMDQKQPQKALKEYKKVEAMDPNNGLLLVSLYNFYKTQKDTVKADELYRKAFENRDIAVDDKIGMLTQFMSVENQSIETAELYFKLLIQIHPDNEILHTYYASFLLMQKRYQEAVPQLNAMLAINPKNKDGWLELIKVYFDQNNIDSIQRIASQGLVHLPEEPGLYLFKGISLQLQNKNAEALASFKQGIFYTANNESINKAEFYMYIADIYASDQALDSAFYYYEEAYKLNPNNPTLLNNYAYYLSMANIDLSRAEVMSAKTIQAYPDNISFLDTYAWIFFKQGNMTLAFMYIQQAMDKGGENNPVVIEHYGDILFFSGDKEAAIGWWQKAKEKGNESKILQQKIDTKNYIPEKPYAEK